MSILLCLLVAYKKIKPYESRLKSYSLTNARMHEMKTNILQNIML